MRFRIDRSIGPDAQRSVGFAAADRFDAELDRGGAGGAGGRQRNRRSLGAEGLGKPGRHRAEHEAVVERRIFSAAADAQQIVVIGVLLCGGAAKLEPLRPFDFDRGDREKQRSREITLGADARLLQRFLGGHFGKPFGEAGR